MIHACTIKQLQAYNHLQHCTWPCWYWMKILCMTRNPTAMDCTWWYLKTVISFTFSHVNIFPSFWLYEIWNSGCIQFFVQRIILPLLHTTHVSYCNCHTLVQAQWWWHDEMMKVEPTHNVPIRSGDISIPLAVGCQGHVQDIFVQANNLKSLQHCNAGFSSLLACSSVFTAAQTIDSPWHGDATITGAPGRISHTTLGPRGWALLHCIHLCSLICNIQVVLEVPLGLEPVRG